MFFNDGNTSDDMREQQYDSFVNKPWLKERFGKVETGK